MYLTSQYISVKTTTADNKKQMELITILGKTRQ